MAGAAQAAPAFYMPQHVRRLSLDFSPRIWKGGALQAAENGTVRITTPALGAPPLLNQEESCLKCSPPQMRRGGAPSAGVVLTVVAPSATEFFRSLFSPALPASSKRGKKSDLGLHM